MPNIEYIGPDSVPNGQPSLTIRECMNTMQLIVDLWESSAPQDRQTLINPDSLLLVDAGDGCYEVQKVEGDIDIEGLIVICKPWEVRHG